MHGICSNLSISHERCADVWWLYKYSTKVLISIDFSPQREFSAILMLGFFKLSPSAV